MKNVLFVGPKWCDANPELSFNTNDFFSLYTTFSKYKSDYHWDVLNMDESVVTYGSHINNIIVEHCRKYKVEIVFFSLINGFDYNPSIETLKELRKMGIYLCFFWPDTGPEWGFGTIQSLQECSDLHISYDSPRSQWHDEHPKWSNYLPMWTPHDDNLFYRDPQKEIDVSFLGTYQKHPERIACLSYWQKKIPTLFISGGQRQEKLSIYQYALYVRKSKMGVNFPLSQTQVFLQAKGRIFEHMACETLLFDVPNPATRDFFKPGEEYIEFSTPDDFVEKVNYYLKHEDERKAIAERGSNAFYAKYSGKIFWDKLMHRIEGEQHD